MKEIIIENPNELPWSWMPAYVGKKDTVIEMFRKRYGKAPRTMITLQQKNGRVIYLYN